MMLKGERPASCLKCFKEEDAGHRSKRQWETAKWINELGLDDILDGTGEDGTIPPRVRYIDLRLGSKCNLACVMCSPHDSSKWVKEYKGNVADTPMDAAKDSDFIFTCVGNDNDLREVTFGDNGAFKTIKKGAIYIDNTTASATIAREIYDYSKKNNFGFLDAPVSGGQAGAENGALTVMIGGDEDSFDKDKNIIDCYSKKMKLLGKAGNGQLAKMVNQICIAGLVQGLSEGINFGIKAGLNMEDVIEVISKGAAQSWQMDNRYKTMIDDKFEFGFAVDWMRKDLKIALEEAKKNNSLLPITEIVDQYYGDVQKLGGKRWDTSSLIKRLRK